MRALGLLTMALAAASCSQERPLQGAPGAPVTWRDEVAPLFAAKCTSCHSGAAPAGGYATTSYNEALGPDATPVAIAGDPNSLLLTTLDPAKADDTHKPVSDAYATARAWVVDGRLAVVRHGVHDPGILNPNDAQFHGNVLRSTNWNFATCQKCHGSDYSGGAAGVACTQCHKDPGGPTGCTTCHGQPPQTGSHLAHAGGKLARKLDCTECHVKPAQYNDPGHLLTADGKPKDKATITFGDEASLAGPGRTGAPAFNGATCSNIYCHGGTLADSRATNTTPAWNGGTAACGSCHGLPPASHDASSTVCSACHAQVTPPKGAPMNVALHVDGVVEVGDGSGTCSACHGSAASPAPPRDLSGNTSTTALGVGAHQAHLTGAHELSAPIACSACHVVPTNLHDPGHIDHGLPATITFSGLAVNDSATPSWDRTTGSCSATYCHGGGASMADDTAAKLRKPVWTVGQSQAFCGSCHGLPPSDTAHAGVVFPDCNRCHAKTVAPNGKILVAGPVGARTSFHINGVIDVTP